MEKVCIVGASGTLGQYMVQHALDRGYDVIGVCREQSVDKLDLFKGRSTIFPGATNDREVIKKAVAGCDGVLALRYLVRLLGPLIRRQILSQSPFLKQNKWYIPF